MRISDWSSDVCSSDLNKALTLKLRPGVTFQDGEKFDAEAVKFNIERYKTMQGSQRRGELSAVTTVDVVDPLTVSINTTAPFEPLLATMTARFTEQRRVGKECGSTGKSRGSQSP